MTMKKTAIGSSLLLGGVLLAALPPKPGDLPWSFQRLARPAVPVVKNASWPKDELDRFVLASLENANLQPLGDAPRAVLIRRLAFDLTGLPPTWDEVQAFVSDPSNDDAALAKVVDAYLKSPRFGERWARHWLDVVRYADSVGRTWNAPFTYAWRYRDWVIDSFNADKPYSRFVAEQIAGDLLPATSVAQRRDQITGTGLLALGSMDLSEGDPERFVLDQVDDQIDVTTRAFLGMTIACARCHDHKTDPVSQKDYYALAGVFYSSQTFPGQANKSNLTGAMYVDPEMLVDLPTKLDEKLGPPTKLPDGIHSMGDIQDATRGVGGNAPPYDTDPHFAMGVLEGKVQNCDLRVGGDPHEREGAPRRGEMDIPMLPKLPAIPAGQSGRLQFAQWMTQPTHPLTSRVMVNRVWTHLFGKGIVRTVDDFGMTGADPKNAALLDHLAVRFVSGGWSVKQLIRSIVLSRTYRLESASSEAHLAADGDNDLHWRMNPRRLEFEALRDAMMLAAGRLEFERPEGIQVAGTGGKGNGGRPRSLLGLDAPYRTLFLPVMRDLLADAYSTWDFPPPTQIKGQRDVTTVAHQALWFMNSALAEELADDVGKKESIEAIYHAILNREPTVEEKKDAEDLASTAGWTALAQALMATAEFRYVF